MNYPKLYEMLYTEPWEVLERTHAAWIMALNDHVASGRELTPPSREALGRSRSNKDERWYCPVELSDDGRLAVMSIQGTMGKRLSWLETYCGGCDLAHVDRDLEELRADDRVETVVFDFDSPGGLALASSDTTERLLKLTEEKRTVAYSDGLMCSAAYKMAAGCTEIYAAKSAEVGSVGTFAAIVDRSKEYDELGRKVHVFRASKYKAMGYPGKPVTDAELALMQERVEQLDATFKQYVINQRPSIDREALEGQEHDGVDAVGLGFLDGIYQDLSECLADEMERL
ncbi:MAG: S49 family peptidase [Verrucomicrobiota bacterium]